MIPRKLNLPPGIKKQMDEVNSSYYPKLTFKKLEEYIDKLINEKSTGNKKRSTDNLSGGSDDQGVQEIMDKGSVSKEG